MLGATGEEKDDDPGGTLLPLKLLLAFDPEG